MQESHSISSLRPFLPSLLFTAQLKSVCSIRDTPLLDFLNNRHLQKHTHLRNETFIKVVLHRTCREDLAACLSRTPPGQPQKSAPPPKSSSNGTTSSTSDTPNPSPTAPPRAPPSFCCVSVRSTLTTSLCSLGTLHLKWLTSKDLGCSHRLI
jgi:hypothetical protein